MTSQWMGSRDYLHETVLSKIANLPQKTDKMFVRLSDGRIDYVANQQNPMTPWIFIKTCPHRHCQLWNGVYFPIFNLIPSFCRFCCWKVVIKPKTVESLFTLYDFLCHLNVNSKCGIDHRPTTEGPYAGFIYNDSLQLGREMYERVLLEMQDWFNLATFPDVFLKRGCTEMEMSLPSDCWDTVNKDQIELEQKLDEVFVKREDCGVQSDWLIQYKKSEFIRHAIEIGDKTWRRLVNDPSRYIPHTVHYETDESFKKTMSENGSEQALDQKM